MKVLVVRHALSEANNRSSLAFGSVEAPLMEEGRVKARELGKLLVAKYDVNLEEVTAATSQLVRARETAEEAGLNPKKTVTNPLLNEVVTGLAPLQLRAVIDAEELPEAAEIAAIRLLDAPPEQPIWIAHGLLIASLCRALGTAQDQRFIPHFCEVRELDI